MASVKNMQQDTVASIDAAKAIEDVLKVMGVLQPNTSFPRNPIGFILQLLKHVGVTYEELRLWLSNFLIFVLPSLEISVKTILLTNLKSMISCSVDPRIPNKYRKSHHCNEAYIEDYGFDIGVESIDFFDKLSENPLSDYGKELYFGVEGINDVYKFARAEDFDAFIWFVMHRGKFPNAAKISDMSTFTDNIHGMEAKSVKPSNATLLTPLVVSYDSNSPSNILLGNTFTYTGSPNVVAMCIDRMYDNENRIVENTIVPVSSDICSVNWYIKRADQLTKNLGLGRKTSQSRDYSKERAICNLQYIDQASSNLSPANGFVNNKLKLTILPKPYIHIPNINKGEKPWGFVSLLFDSLGNYDVNGQYTIPLDSSKEEKETETIYLDAVSVDHRSGNVIVINKNKLISKLVECYKGLTVYEFNYDFVMGMKLFDAKVMATSLLDSLINTRLGISIGIGKKHQEATDEIREIIKDIINSDSSVEDCYFKFDNSKYERLLRLSEERRARQYDFGSTASTIGSFDDVRAILDEYDENATLEEQVDVINRTITQASIVVSSGVEEKDRYGVEFGFIFDLIENLTVALVNAVLTPKVLMLLEVNRQLMGGSWRAFTVKDLLKSMTSIIISLVSEVRDLMLQELIKLLFKYLDPIKEMLVSILLREQIENYTEAINDIMRNCISIWSDFGNESQENKLDTVDYADIDTNKTISDDKPKENC